MMIMMLITKILMMIKISKMILKINNCRVNNKDKSNRNKMRDNSMN